MDLLYLQGSVFPAVSAGEAWSWMNKTSDPYLTDMQLGSH